MIRPVCQAGFTPLYPAWAFVCSTKLFMSHHDEYDDDRDDEPIDGVGFARPGSALRAATRDNPRNLPCPNCGAENVLTALDRARGYQCDSCADRAERGCD